MQRTIFSNAPIASVHHASAAAWRLLIQPIADQVAGAKYLIIAPDRFLYDVPYAALYDGRFLVENHVITITPGASLLLRPKRAMRFSPALVVGDPDESLPGARNEASRIAQSYAAAFVLIGPAATVDSFFLAARDAALIHYAGHARSSRTAPGVIPLGVSQTLTSDQIAHCRLRRAPIVVLAACATLRGNAEHVESMPSIARGFLAAGAQTVVGTLWNIPDDTADSLFETFHRKLRVSKSAGEALAMTQRSFLQSKNERSHPANWAAAEVLGN
jgi:CHAT domain-containing protein